MPLKLKITGIRNKLGNQSSLTVNCYNNYDIINKGVQSGSVASLVCAIVGTTVVHFVIT